MRDDVVGAAFFRSRLLALAGPLSLRIAATRVYLFMRAYFIRRLLLIPPTLLGITLVVFLITRFAPGGPLERAEMEARVGEPGSRSSRAGRTTQLSQAQLDQLKVY